MKMEGTILHIANVGRGFVRNQWRVNVMRALKLGRLRKERRAWARHRAKVIHNTHGLCVCGLCGFVFGSFGWPFEWLRSLVMLFDLI